MEGMIASLVDAGTSAEVSQSPEVTEGEPSTSDSVEAGDTNPTAPDDKDTAMSDTGPEDSAASDTAQEDLGKGDAGEDDPTRPASPTLCSDINQGSCECNDDQGFTTWTWWVADQQRCATTYVPPSADGPLPVLLSNDCYSTNGLGQCRTNSEMVEAANRFGFVGLCTTSADGNWTFGNDGVINDDTPTPCAEADSKEEVAFV